MKKILIGPHNLDAFVQEDRLCLAREHILSPGARDAARNRGISIVYENAVGADKPCNNSNGTKNADPNSPAPDHPATKESREDLSRRIVTLLRTECNLIDPETVKQVTLKVLQRLEMS